MSGEWVYGYYFVNKRTNQHIIKPIEDIRNYQEFRVIPQTVGQFTCLKDKNQNKIFEDDVVSGCDFNSSVAYGKIVWHENMFAVYPLPKLEGMDDIKPNINEVVGNIHDNLDFANYNKTNG